MKSFAVLYIALDTRLRPDYMVMLGLGMNDVWVVSPTIAALRLRFQCHLIQLARWRDNGVVGEWQDMKAVWKRDFRA